MQPIFVTPETLAQYRKDCRADRMAEKVNHPKPSEIVFIHDRFMFGKTVFIPKYLIAHRFSKEDLHAIAF